MVRPTQKILQLSSEIREASIFLLVKMYLLVRITKTLNPQIQMKGPQKAMCNTLMKFSPLEQACCPRD